MKRRSFKGIIDIIDNGAPPKIDNPQGKNKRKAEDGSSEAQGEKLNDGVVKEQEKQTQKQTQKRNGGQPGQQLSKKARKAAARAAAAAGPPEP